MKTKEIAIRYSIDKRNFEVFLERNRLKCTFGMAGGATVDDSLVEEYVNLYKTDLEQKKEIANKTNDDQNETQTSPLGSNDKTSLTELMMDASRFSTASGNDLPYVVLQVTLKEKFFGTGSGNLSDLEEVINAQVAKGYRLHTMSTSNGGSKGLAGGDRIQATLVFERLDMR